MNVEFTPEAIEDVISQSNFWESRDESLLEPFEDEIDEAVNVTIPKAPEGYHPLDLERNIRRYCTKRFHTHIVYRYLKEQGLIRILSVYNSDMDDKPFLSRF